MKPLVRPLRYRLFLLAASGLLPLAIVAAIVVAYVTGEREHDAQDASLAVSRAIASAVDAELSSTVGILQSLSLSDELQPARHADFHSLARRIAERQGWRAIVLADRVGRVILTSSQPLGSASPRPVEEESMQRVIATREPTVGTVAEGPQRMGPAFAVRVPVLAEGQLQYVLSAVVPVEQIRSVVQRQRLSPTSVVGIFDQHLNRIARSRMHASARPSPSLEALLRQGKAEGAGTTWTLEGVKSQTGYVRLPGSGWVVATGMSVEDADRGMYGVLGAVGAGLLASLALAAFMAWYFARDVTEPIDTLKAAAGALGRGEPVDLQPLGIAELEEVGRSLQIASAERDRANEARRAAEAERESLLTRVTEALRRAEDAARSKDEFLAMLGHELRNPLAPMATALHLMARKGDPGTRLEREVMERQVAHMKRLVDDLLDVSRITGKRLQMRQQPLRLAELVRHAGQSVQPVLGLRRLDVDVAPEAAELWVSGDEVRLVQVLNNLLGNAVKFTGPEGRIALALRRVDDDAEITVGDDGMGMPPEVLEHVFDLFYQAPQEADRARGGLGLGLAIVRSLVEMHGGSVQARSGGPGEGSCFAVRLPTIAAPAGSEEGAAAAQAADGKGRILLVDDNQDAADTAASLLELSGYEVKVAYDPGVALTMLDDFMPQVAVLDIGLPGMSGYELAQRLRAHRNGHACYLVALTGYGTTADITKSREAGFGQHLVKPAGPDALLHAVQEGLGTA
ncbi:response regulator [Ramlibacter sp. USB13]|uniref:histidine kinase n=1 Tax=Ramlibacter cellulosilyticus TaxID=2764187 RepID=A0A923MQ46_9BURK|nr:ATP-binding protein [Ramlibacter cellulosilyticus]MBC5783173.1 response regulator [Ramlibacter cellulosilyticus]